MPAADSARPPAARATAVPSRPTAGSSPVGYIGTCNLNITTQDGGVLYTTCIYASAGTVFAQPCGDTYAFCTVQTERHVECVRSRPHAGARTAPAGALLLLGELVRARHPVHLLSSRPMAVPALHPHVSLLHHGAGRLPSTAGIITTSPAGPAGPSGQTCSPDTMNLPAWLGLCGP